MASKYYVGKVYSVSPSSIRFDETFIEYNRKYDDVEYEALKQSIETVGQEEPIIINSTNGLCEDGRTRTQICVELDISIKCIQIDGTLPITARRDLYMKNTTGREYSIAQKAVMAYRYIKLTNCRTEDAAKKHKVKSQVVTAVLLIAGLGREDIIEALLNDGQWNGSKNVRAIATGLKKSVEKIKEVDSNTPKIDYVELISTAAAQEKFWGLKNLVQLSQHELNMVLVEYLNLKYVHIVDAETGEVT